MRIRLSVFVAMLLGGCGHTLHDVRIPLADAGAAAASDAPRVVIEDARDPVERKTHLGKDIWSCERWFGDKVFQPPKLAWLDALIAESVPPRISVRLQLDRFDTVEFCENSGKPGGSTAARNAGSKGLPRFEAGAAMGDTVLLRLAGTINGVPFDVARSFDYGNLPYTFPNPPSSHPMYRALLRENVRRLVDEIVRKIPKADLP
jgi:hypothetical protein